MPLPIFPWRRKWQPTPVFLPGESHGQRSLAGYSPWGHTEVDTTEPAHDSKFVDENCPFPIEWSRHPCRRSLDHICEGGNQTLLENAVTHRTCQPVILMVQLWLCPQGPWEAKSRKMDLFGRISILKTAMTSCRTLYSHSVCSSLRGGRWRSGADPEVAHRGC